MVRASYRLVSSHLYAEGQEVLWNWGCLLVKVISILCRSSQNGDWLVLSTVCKPVHGGLLSQLFRRIGIGVGNKGSGPGEGQLPLGPLHYLVLIRKKQLELSKASHRHGVPIPLVILFGRVDRCSRTKPESYQEQSRERPMSSAW